MIDARAAALLDAMPSHTALRLGMFAIVVLLALACLWHAHPPPRDRGGFR
jgi:hypothetical protein